VVCFRNDVQIRRYLRRLFLTGYFFAYTGDFHTVKLITEAFQPQVFIGRQSPAVDYLHGDYVTFYSINPLGAFRNRIAPYCF
jgi:hypothetical protein